MYITASQVAHFESYSQEDFLRRVILFVVEAHTADPSDPMLRRTCEDLVRHARNWGFSTELEVATFTLCGFSLGPGFPGDIGLPFRELLLNSEMTHAAKSDKMIDLFEQLEQDNGD